MPDCEFRAVYACKMLVSWCLEIYFYGLFYFVVSLSCIGDDKYVHAKLILIVWFHTPKQCFSTAVPQKVFWQTNSGWQI